MSVIAAKVYNDKIIMAADSILVINDWSKRNTGFAKIAEINGMIAGSTGSAKEASLMWHYMQTHKPASASEKDMLTFIVEFAQWKSAIDGSNVENGYLIAYNGHLFEVSGIFVHEISDYIAIGAGMDYANAAMYLGHTPREAVKVACELSCYVCEPIVEYSMNRETSK